MYCQDAYELQVAQDIQEAEQWWLYELEQDEQEWSKQRTVGTDGKECAATYLSFASHGVDYVR